MKYITTIILLISLISSTECISQRLDSLPVVFTVGEYGKQYEELVSECELPLLQATAMSMDMASRHWLKVLSELEVFCENNGFDIKGVKLWMNIFWKADGQIKHIVFFPKRSSRNIDFTQLGIVLKAFAEQSKGSLLAPACYSHFGSASFPTHADYILNEK